MELTIEQEKLYKWYANGFLKRSNEYGDKQELTFFKDGFFVMNSETGEKSSQTIHKDLTPLLQKQLPFTVLSLNQQSEERGKQRNTRSLKRID